MHDSHHWVNKTVAFVLGVAGAFTVFHIFRKWRSKRTNNITWEDVGVVLQLKIHPLKSAGCVDVLEAEATKLGLRLGLLEDRSFVVLKNKIFVTGREAPRLVTLKTSLEDNILRIFNTDSSCLEVDISVVNLNKNIIQFRFRDADVEGYDCGDDAAAWISEVLYNNTKEARLVYGGQSKWTRPKRSYPYQLKNHENRDTPHYTDCSSYMLMTQSSMHDLNSKLANPVNFNYFRPSVIISGTKPYDEDSWEFVQIGEKVVIRVIKPCERCLLTQINPSNGLKDSKHFECLKKYRMVTWPYDMAKAWKNNPIFGAHCGIDVEGTIRIGDPVKVIRQNPLQWKIGSLDNA